MAFHHASAIHTNAAQIVKSFIASRFRVLSSLKRKPMFAFVHSS